MRVGLWDDMQQPEPNGFPVRRGPRYDMAQTFGGNVVLFSRPGHPGDDMVTLKFNAMLASPAVTVVRSRADVAAAVDTLIPNERLAYRIPVAAGEFVAASAARLYLTQNGACTGYLTVEIWSGDAVNNYPDTYQGTIGFIDVDDIDTAPGYSDIEVWSDAAYPCDPTVAYLVLCGEELTAGIVSWGGTAAAPANGYAKYTAGAWAAANGELSGTVWQGTDFCIWRGLAGAERGGRDWEIDLEDGQLYTGQVVEVAGQKQVHPVDAGGAIGLPPASAGVARRVTVSLALHDELD